MKVIIDVNIILSAIIRNSSTRGIIVKSGLELYFPEDSLHKIRKYQEYIIEKSGLTKEAYLKIMKNLFKFIKLIPTEDLKNNWNEAKKIMESVDPEDVMFIAAALSLNNSIIWSDDKDFEKQDKITTLKTKEVFSLFSQ